MSSPAGDVHAALGRGAYGRFATTAPGPNDDADDDPYNTVGATWVKTDTDQAWICVDQSTGAAVWHPVPARKVRGSNLAHDGAALTSDTTLSFPVTAGAFYGFRFVIVCRSAVAATGIVVALSFPALGGSGVFAARASVPNGTGQNTSHLTASDGESTSAGISVAAANTDYIATIEGVIRTGSSGSVTFRFRPETSGDTVTVRPGSYVEWSQQVAS